MIEYTSIAISILALSVSTLTLWFTLLRRGKLKMTKPTVIFFGYDFTPNATPKVFLRTLLFSTGEQGNVIESMYAQIFHDQRSETFSFWGYGDKNDLVPGSGLYVSKAGVSLNHHFVLSMSRPNYSFEQGDYTIEVYAKTVGKAKSSKLSTIKIHLKSEHATALSRQDGVLFELAPESQEYVGRTNERNI